MKHLALRPGVQEAPRVCQPPPTNEIPLVAESGMKMGTGMVIPRFGDSSRKHREPEAPLLLQRKRPEEGRKGIGWAIAEFPFAAGI